MTKALPSTPPSMNRPKPGQVTVEGLPTGRMTSIGIGRDARRPGPPGRRMPGRSEPDGIGLAIENSHGRVPIKKG
jgi:hypothetical protein